MSNDAYKLKYLKYKEKYLELKNMFGGAEAEKYVVGMRVKRVKGDDDVYADGSIHRAEALGKYGIIKSIQEEKEWPPGSGKMLPKMYFIDFKNHYEGTKHEGVTISVIEDDLELVPSYQGQQLSSRVPEMPGRRPIQTRQAAERGSLRAAAAALAEEEYGGPRAAPRTPVPGLPEKEIEVQVGTRIALLPLYKIGEPIEMNDKQLSAYKLRPEYGRLIDADENTIMISELPGFKSYLFKVKIIPTRYYGKSSTKQLIRLK